MGSANVLAKLKIRFQSQNSESGTKPAVSEELKTRCCQLTAFAWGLQSRSSFSHHCCHQPSSPSTPPPLPPPHLQGLVPAVWTEAPGAGSPALCAGSPGSSSPPSEPRTGSSTLHISAQPEPGTAEGEQGRGWYLGFPGVVQLTLRAALGPQWQELRSTPAPACSAAAALRSFSPPALSAVTLWLSAHSCFSGLPSPSAPFSFPTGNISVNLMQFNKYTLNFCVPILSWGTEMKRICLQGRDTSNLVELFFLGRAGQGKSLR